MITRLLRGMGRWVNHTSLVAVVTQTDRPKSVRNCCLIEFFCGVVCVVTLHFWHFCLCRGFCHRTGSDLLLFVTITQKVSNTVIFHRRRVTKFRGQKSKSVICALFLSWNHRTVLESDDHVRCAISLDQPPHSSASHFFKTATTIPHLYSKMVYGGSWGHCWYTKMSAPERTSWHFWRREKGRDLTQSRDKNPYTHPQNNPKSNVTT